MILVPSDLIIQKKKIPGYNNVLTLATDKMKFGKNTNVNYKAPSTKATPTEVRTSSQTLTEGRTSSQTPTEKSSLPKPKPKQPTQAIRQPKPTQPTLTLASEVLGVTTIIGGFLISKYIL